MTHHSSSSNNRTFRTGDSRISSKEEDSLPGLLCRAVFQPVVTEAVVGAEDRLPVSPVTAGDETFTGRTTVTIGAILMLRSKRTEDRVMDQADGGLWTIGVTI